MKASVTDQHLLLNLQEVDTAISHATTKMAALPEREQITAIHARMKIVADELVIAQAALTDVTIDLRRSEVDVEQVSARMEKDEKRLASGTGSPKELEHTQHELVTLAKRKAELEDGELEIMMKVEEAQARVNTLLSDEDGLKQLELELNVRLENAVTEFEREIALKRSERTLVAPKIDASLIELYEKIRAKEYGIGAGALVGGKCGGCNLAVNAIELERIKSLDLEEVVRCEECRRILVRI
jgi:predicted  nucleic acid-binding Zn-ribbon protein